jgi:hypothetical protein
MMSSNYKCDECGQYKNLTPEQVKANDEFFAMGEVETKLQDYMLQEHGITMVESQLQSLLHEAGLYRLRQENEALQGTIESCHQTKEALVKKCKAYEQESERLRGLFGEMDKYLDTHKETTIGSGSIFHKQIKEALNDTK